MKLLHQLVAAPALATALERACEAAGRNGGGAAILGTGT